MIFKLSLHCLSLLFLFLLPKENRSDLTKSFLSGMARSQGSIICHEINQTEFAGAVVAPAEGEDRNDGEDGSQPEQDADELQVAELRQRGKSLRLGKLGSFIRLLMCFLV